MQTLPLRFDLFALLILLGVVQGLFLGAFFLSGSRRRNTANQCVGYMMLAFGAILFEVWLEYTNYMFRTLALIDFAEPFNFVLGPLFFFFVFSRLHQKLPRHWGWHLFPFGIWVVNAVTWIYQPATFHYNSYLNAWHPELPFVASEDYMSDDFTGLRDYVNELTLLSCGIYSLWSLRILYRHYQRRGWSFWRFDDNKRNLDLLKILSVLYAVLPLLIVVIKTRYYEDLGDHIIASYLTVTIYTTTFLLLSGSEFFRDENPKGPLVEQPAPITEPRRKYEKSALSDEHEAAILTRLTEITQTQKPYLDNNFSLAKLADQLGTSPHYVSQVLNDCLGQTFFDWLANHRIAEAQRILNDPQTAHLKIEEIAEQVGYNAPSAFHTAFKRITGQTPASFRSARTSS